jgi:hypothetical protein
VSRWLARFTRADRRPQTWLNVLYLLAALPPGIAYFVVLVVGVSVGAAGAGEVAASGTADRLTATIQGAGDARLSDLAVRTATVVVQGAGEAHLTSASGST